MHSQRFDYSEKPCPNYRSPLRVAKPVDQFSQAVLSFMYEAGLLIVSADNSVVTVVPDGVLASCQEVVAYDEPSENYSAVVALKRLQADGLAECDLDDMGRRIYQLSFKGRLTAQKICYRQKP